MKKLAFPIPLPKTHALFSLPPQIMLKELILVLCWGSPRPPLRSWTL